jgi:hypothetical protein
MGLKQQQNVRQWKRFNWRAREKAAMDTCYATAVKILSAVRLTTSQKKILL